MFLRKTWLAYKNEIDFSHKSSKIKKLGIILLCVWIYNFFIIEIKFKNWTLKYWSLLRVRCQRHKLRIITYGKKCNSVNNILPLLGKGHFRGKSDIFSLLVHKRCNKPRDHREWITFLVCHQNTLDIHRSLPMGWRSRCRVWKRGKSHSNEYYIQRYREIHTK